MAKDTFQLDITQAGLQILQDMVKPTIKDAGDAIAARASSMASSISADPPQFEVSTTVGTIKQGKRAIATVKAATDNRRKFFVANTVLVKARDAGRIR